VTLVTGPKQIFFARLQGHFGQRDRSASGKTANSLMALGHQRLPDPNTFGRDPGSGRAHSRPETAHGLVFTESAPADLVAVDCSVELAAQAR
jgi:hypothetical protein